MAGADHGFLVCTPQLGSLHLARRAVKLLQQLEFDSSRFQVLINRMHGRSELSSSDLSKIFDCRVDGTLPEDKAGVNTAQKQSAALDVTTPLGKAIDSLAGKMPCTAVDKRKSPENPAPRKAALTA
jgi:Flp pilus assembly CpaE family ATPase